MYFDEQDHLRSMLASWTDVPTVDEFAQASAGRSWFRVDDLLRLCTVLDAIRGGSRVK
jgi:hypothetical protein